MKRSFLAPGTVLILLFVLIQSTGFAYFIFNDSFEPPEHVAGSSAAAPWNPWYSTDNTVTTAEARSGAQSVNIVPGALGQDIGMIHEGIYKFSFRFSNTSQQFFYYLSNGGGGNGAPSEVYLAILVSRGSGIIYKVNGAYQYPALVPGGITINQWHDVEIHYDITAGTFDFWYDGAPVQNDVPMYISNPTGGGFIMRCYLDSISASGATYIDDFALEKQSPPPEIIDVALTDEGIELTTQQHPTDSDTLITILWADNPAGEWWEAGGVVTIPVSGTWNYVCEGFGSSLFMMCDGENGRIYGSSYLPLQFFEFDLTTREHFVRGNPFTIAGGEVYSILPFSPTKVYAAAYGDADMIVYDSTQPWLTPGGKAAASGTNPTYLGTLGDEQNRPIDMLTGPDGYVYIGTTADYGKKGGAVTKLDPSTNSWTVYRHCIYDQQIITLSEIAGNSSLIAGGSSATASGYPDPTGVAKLFLWDTNLDTVVYEVTPPVGVEKLEVAQLESTESGMLIGTVRGGGSIYLFVFNPVSRTFIHTSNITSIIGTSSIFGHFSPPYNGKMYFAVNGRICTVNTTTYQVSVVATYPGARRTGAVIADPADGGKMKYFFLTNTEMISMSLDPGTLYQFENHGPMADIPFNARVDYGPGASGNNDMLYLVFNNAHTTWFLLAFDTNSGEYTQHVAQVDDDYAQYGTCVGPDNRFYISSVSGHLSAYDPVHPELGLVDLGQTTPGEGYPFNPSNAFDGKIYMGSYPRAKLISYDPATGQFTDYGRVADDEMYSYTNAAYSSTYAYVVAGPVRYRVVRMNLITGARDEVSLPPGLSGYSGSLYIHLGTDGKVYVTIYTSPTQYAVIENGGTVMTLTGTIAPKYGIKSIPGASFSFDWQNQQIDYSLTEGTRQRWVDSGDTADGRPDPRDPPVSQRFYKIVH
jgi:hypothetical protein